MLKLGKRDILVHFDEDRNEIVLYTVSANETASIRAKEFDGAKLDIQFLSQMQPEEAEQTLGDTIFSLIDTFSKRKTGIRPYEELIAESHRQEIAGWESQAAQGDPAAQYMLFIEFHSQALSNCDADALEKAETMLEAAVSQGYEQAIARKDHWPLMRAAAEQKIKRGSSA